MFGLLNPLALWLVPFLTAPLLIHFLGRIEPKLRDFPSLMPVRGRLSQAMQRHHLKNWLQLLLRTLALLFLLLAAANPLWRSRHGLTPPAAAGLLVYNGAYGATPLSGQAAGRSSPAGQTILGSQERLQRGLDSLTFGHGHAELLLPGIPNGETSARFGRYSDALSRLLAQVQPEMNDKASFHLYLPVFDWRDLEESREILLRALQQNPNLRLILTEYPGARGQLTPFSGWSLSFPKDNVAALRTGMPFSSNASTALWTPAGESPREIPVARDSVEIQLPITEAGWLNGEISLPPPSGDGFGFPSMTVSARIPPPSILCHVGNAFASLASLGRGGIRSRVKSFGDAQELDSEHCDFLYLADPKDMDASLLERAAEIIREGGKVILGLGRNSDLALLNRNLLEPLGVGTLSELKQQDATPVRPNAAAFSSLGMRVKGWGEPGVVKSYIALSPASGTTVLLSAGEDPILVHRRIGKGELFLWTTDVDDPEWTDLGLGPWVVLIHQLFISGAGNSGIGIQEIASDSVSLFPASESDEVRVTDPQGSPFKEVEGDPDGWRIGPFDRLGLYRIDWGHGDERDTSWLAVGLDSSRVQSGPQSDAGARDRFILALGDMRSKVSLLNGGDPGDNWRTLYGGFRLRTWMLGAAALLLFLEGLVSLRLRPMSLVARRD